MKIKKFKFNKVKSTNNTAIRIIKEKNYKLGMVIAEIQFNNQPDDNTINFTLTYTIQNFGITDEINILLQ